MTRALSIDDVTAITVPFEPAISPDGKRVVYVVRHSDTENDCTATNLWIIDGDADPVQLTRTNDDTSPAWSPDGTSIAFVRLTDAAPQVWRLTLGGGEAEPLTSLPGGAGAPVWSPDNQHLAFIAAVDAGPAGGGIHSPIVIDRIDYQADGLGAFGTVRMQLFVLDIASGATRQLTFGDEHVASPAWSPDGQVLAFTSGVPGEGQSLARPVFTIEALNPKASPKLTAFAQGRAETLLWTQDGKSLLVAGHEGDPTGHTRLMRVDLISGEVTDLAGVLDRNVMVGAPAYPGASPALIDGGQRVLFCVRDRGLTHLYAVAVAGGVPEAVLTGDSRVVAGMTTAAGVVAISLVTKDSFGEIVTVDLTTAQEKLRTHHGQNFTEVTRFPHTERSFTISDGVEVHGWILSDPEQQGPRPLLVDIHGGPHNAWNDVADEMHLYHQDLVARGWAVLILNPRGSDGYGESFYTAVSGQWGTSDAKDFLEPVDSLVTEGLADPKRLGVTGYSYGGFMTCFLTGRDNRFSAAVAGGVVSDLVSMAGTCADAELIGRVELGAAPWQEPAHYAEMSPYTRIADVTTPTLVLHGDADRTCPVGQAQQWFTALKQRGIPTEMVLYPGAGHILPIAGRPSHRLDYNRRTFAWLERFAGDSEGSRPAPLDAHHWQSRLESLAQRHGVVGAQLGILRLGSGSDELIQGATGTLNKLTGVPVTTDSIFQIGSISKVWTATIIMQLIDEGKFSLETPVVELVPELMLVDDQARAGVTIRHLLNHTSGIDGDLFPDTGRGDDAVAKLVAMLAGATQNHPLGATWSYCNSGYVLLGFVIQKVTGDTWEEAIQKRLATPLGLVRTVTLPQDAIRYSVAIGHVPGPGGENVPAPIWDLPRSVGPAGLIVQSTDELLAFARMHMKGGLAADGTRVLSEKSTLAMAEQHAELPDKLTAGDSWGLGWIRFGWNEHRLIGHDGSTIGQNSYLRILPEMNLAVTLLTNGGPAGDLFRDLCEEIFDQLACVELPPLFAPPTEPAHVDATPFLGVYERASARLQVLRDDGGALKLAIEPTGDMAEISGVGREEYALIPVSENIFAIQLPGVVGWMPVTFFSLDSGERYVHFGARATPLVSKP